MNDSVDFNSIRRAFQDDSIKSANNYQPDKAIGILANTSIANDNVRHQAEVMAGAIHSMLLRRLLDGQETINQKAQFWFMVLAIAGLASAIVQIVVALIR